MSEWEDIWVDSLCCCVIASSQSPGVFAVVERGDTHVCVVYVWVWAVVERGGTHVCVSCMSECLQVCGTENRLFYPSNSLSSNMLTRFSQITFLPFFPFPQHPSFVPPSFITFSSIFSSTSMQIRNILVQFLFQILVLAYLLLYGFSDFSVESGSPQHLTIVFNTFVFCQIFNEVNAR